VVKLKQGEKVVREKKQITGQEDKELILTVDGGESIVAVLYPKKGIISIHDFLNLLVPSIGEFTLKRVIKEKDIKCYRLTNKNIFIDLEDMWNKLSS